MRKNSARTIGTRLGWHPTRFHLACASGAAVGDVLASTVTPPATSAGRGGCPRGKSGRCETCRLMDRSCGPDCPLLSSSPPAAAAPTPLPRMGTGQAAADAPALGRVACGRMGSQRTAGRDVTTRLPEAPLVRKRSIGRRVGAKRRSRGGDGETCSARACASGPGRAWRGRSVPCS